MQTLFQGGLKAQLCLWEVSKRLLTSMKSSKWKKVAFTTELWEVSQPSIKEFNPIKKCWRSLPHFSCICLLFVHSSLEYVKYFIMKIIHEHASKPYGSDLKKITINVTSHSLVKRKRYLSIQVKATAFRSCGKLLVYRAWPTFSFSRRKKVEFGQANP